MKLMLWMLGPDEIKLQGVDIQDYDNPLVTYPKKPTGILSGSNAFPLIDFLKNTR